MSTTEQEAQSGEVIPKLQEVVVFNQVRSDVETMKAANKALVFDYGKQGKEVRSQIHKLKGLNGDIDRAKAVGKEDILKMGRAIDQEANMLKADVADMIEVHAKPLREIEEREEARKEGHRQSIEKLASFAGALEGLTASALAFQLEMAENMVINASFEEFQTEAELTRTHVLTTLRQKLQERKQYEADQEELAEHRMRQAAQVEAQQIEQDRTNKIRCKIDLLRVVAFASDTPDQIQLRIDALDAKHPNIEAEAGYEEFLPVAIQAFTDSRNGLMDALNAANARTEQEKENAELRRQQQEQARNNQLLTKISAFGQLLPREEDGLHTIETKLESLIAPSEAEYGDMYSLANESYQTAKDSLTACQKRLKDAANAKYQSEQEESRERSKRHRNKIHAEIADALMAVTQQTDPELRRLIGALVTLISTGAVPNISIKY